MFKLLNDFYIKFLPAPETENKKVLVNVNRSVRFSRKSSSSRSCFQTMPQVVKCIFNERRGLNGLKWIFCLIPESVYVSVISQVFPCCHHLRTEQRGVKGGPVGTP